MLPDGIVLDEFDSAAFVEGAVVDVTTEPLFTLVALTGPVMASSNLLNRIVPEPSTTVLLAMELMSLFDWQSVGRGKCRRATWWAKAGALGHQDLAWITLWRVLVPRHPDATVGILPS